MPAAHLRARGVVGHGGPHREGQTIRVCPTTRTLPSTSGWPSSGLPLPEGFEDTEAARLAAPILARQRELSRRLADRLCAADGRIQDFLDAYLADTGEQPRLPHRTLVLDEPGLARELSLPFDGDSFTSPLLSSYRLVNGVLHNPRVRIGEPAQGSSTVAEGGLPIPDDKKAVPAESVFGRLLAAWRWETSRGRLSPASLHLVVNLAQAVILLRVTLSAARSSFPQCAVWFTTAAFDGDAFLCPRGNLVANLDFVESIFGNGGDPHLPENDAGLDPDTLDRPHGLHHSRAAPHHFAQSWTRTAGLESAATERQRRDGM